jgi:D-aminoacyl-tRNA deacylase
VEHLPEAKEMKMLYVYSEKDLAGIGIARKLKKMLGEELVRGFPQSVVEFEFLEEIGGYDGFIVLSKHRSESKIPSLTVHSTGNLLKQALLGGKGEELSVSFPRLNGFLLKKLKEKAESRNLLGEFKVSYEATHHGPSSLTKPISFIEIGSDEEMWKREDLHELVAEVIYEAHLLLTENKLPICEKSIGFGGGHYSERHSELTFDRDVCFGHIAPKYALKEGISEKVLLQMFDKNYEGIEAVYVEKKAGNRSFKDTIERFAQSKKVRVVYF